MADPEYLRFVNGAISKISRQGTKAEDFEDLQQQVLLRIIDQDLLARYDASRGKHGKPSSFSNYLYLIVRSVVVNNFVAAQRRERWMNSAVEVVETDGGAPAEARGQTVNRLVLDTYRALATEAATDLVDAELLAEKLEARLATGQKPSRVVEVDGVACPCNRLGVFRLMRLGWSVVEIANVLAIRPRLVSSLVREIKFEAQAMLGIAT